MNRHITKVNRRYGKRVFVLIGDLFSFGALAVTSSLVGVVLIIVFGLSERLTMHGGVLLGLIIATFFINYLHFVKNGAFRSLKRILLEGTVYLIIVEVLFLTLTPLHSLIPKSVLLNLNIIGNITANDQCGTENEIRLAKNFLGGQIDIDQVEIYYGAEPRLEAYMGKLIPHNIVATAYGNYIYVSGTEPCITSITLVHELTHVWQYQEGMGFGPEWVSYWINYYWLYFTDVGSLYNYGGIPGLIKARHEGKRFRDFGLEQQAKIVENYYKLAVLDEYIESYLYLSKTGDIEILGHFVSQEFDL